MNVNNVLISVIVPIYNTEKYLKKCVNSILNQTYTNLEVILVNDGSPDNSLQLCKTYAKKDARVKIIDKENGGLSSARNAGLDVAKGEYISFVDSDDYIVEDFVECLLNTAMKNNTRITCMKNVAVNSSYEITEKVFDTKEIQIVSSHKYIQDLCEKKRSTSVCNKLFVKSIFDERRFEQGRLNEDFFFLASLLLEKNDIAIIDYAGYFYYHREESITHSANWEALIHSVRNSYELKEVARMKYPKLEDSFARLTLFQVRTWLLVAPWELRRQSNSDYQSVLQYLKKCKKFIWTTNLKIQDKIFLSFSILMPKLTSRFADFMRDIVKNATRKDVK